MEKKELYHYGVPGMRWGVRKAINSHSIKQLKGAEDIAKGTSSAFDSASRIAGKAGNNRPSKKVRKELSSMSDQELRAKINRMNMEQQYANLNPSRTSKGAAFARSTLEVAGSVAAIAGSAVTIAIGIKKLKG